MAEREGKELNATQAVVALCCLPAGHWFENINPSESMHSLHSSGITMGLKVCTSVATASSLPPSKRHGTGPEWLHT